MVPYYYIWSFNYWLRVYFYPPFPYKVGRVRYLLYVIQKTDHCSHSHLSAITMYIVRKTQNNVQNIFHIVMSLILMGIGTYIFGDNVIILSGKRQHYPNVNILQSIEYIYIYIRIPLNNIHYLSNLQGDRNTYIQNIEFIYCIILNTYNTYIYII